MLWLKAPNNIQNGDLVFTVFCQNAYFKVDIDALILRLMTILVCVSSYLFHVTFDIKDVI